MEPFKTTFNTIIINFLFCAPALLGKVCSKVNKKGQTAVHKHQLGSANAVKKHKNLQYVKELLSVYFYKNQEIDQ